MKRIFGICLFSLVVIFNGSSQSKTYWHNGLSFGLVQQKNVGQYDESEICNEKYYRVLHFDHLLSASEKSYLQENGIEILEYVSDLMYLVSIEINASATNNNNPEIINAFQLNKNFKLSRTILYGEPCIQLADKSLYVIKYMKDIPAELINKELNKQGMFTDRLNSDHQIFYLTASQSDLVWLSNQPWVQFIDCESAPGEPEDREGRSLHRVNLITANKTENLFLTGKGVGVMVRDDGFVGPHIDFQGRIQQDVISDIGAHGDGVAGIMTGAGNYDPLIEGMAPGADLYVINYKADFLDKTLDIHKNDGVVITNSSYSNGCNMGYSIEAQIVDKQIFENPSLIHVFSAGNSNGADCGYGAGNQWGNVTGGHKIGKNAFTVANLRIDGTLETSSSRGPSKDGRLKPEISARGTNQLSTGPGNSTIVFGGTSAAAPGVAGVCALLYEAYKNQNNNQNPESALIKAAIMNTATDIGTPGPDYQFGFGVIDAYRAYQLIVDKRFEKYRIQHGQEQEYEINIPPGSPLVKFMIYWAEPEAALLASKALINDLDLEVIDPNGNTLKPWLLNPNPNPITLAAGATKGIDTLNNVEQVSISFPDPGIYKIRIKGKFLPSNSVDYYLLHEVEDKLLRLSYPIGGENFSITESTQIHYTSYGTDSLKIYFSTDAGNNWTLLATQNPFTRLHSIFIPNNLSSDSCLVEIIQGNEKVRSGLFTVTTGVQGFTISKYCPNEIELSWKRGSKDSFLIYQLGQKYMEAITATTDTIINILNDDPRIVKWFSMAAYDKSILSRRELAISTPDTLIGCGITTDLALALSESNSREFFSCGELQFTPKIKVINRTNRLQTGFTIKAISKSTIIEQMFNHSIAAYDTIEIVLDDAIIVENYGNKTVTVWLDFNQDENPFNDTIFIPLQIVELSDKNGVYPMLESFVENALPQDWFQKFEAVDSRWNVVNVKDKNGINSNSLMYTNANSIYNSFPVNLISRTVDLTNSIQPYLYLDFVHHHFTDNTFFDSLRIKVKKVCGRDHYEQVLLSGVSMELNTIEPTTNQNWQPVDTSWFWLAYDLTAFKGSKIVVEFEIIRGRGNRTFLDNVFVREKLPETKQADFTMTPDPGCYSKPITFTDNSTINGKQYVWDVGLFGSPRFYNGKGPFNSRYTSLGTKRVILKVKSDIDQDAIIIKDLALANTPSANYTFKIQNFRTVQFTNTSVNADTYLWDFGDGTTSTEIHPNHSFDSAKVYRVKLTISNPCGIYSRSVFVDLTFTSNQETTEEFSIELFPNPAMEMILIKAKENIHSYRIFNAEGKYLMSEDNIYAREKEVGLKNLISGLYTLFIDFKNRQLIRKFEKK